MIQDEAAALVGELLEAPNVRQNPQLWQNNEASTAPVVEEYVNSPDRLYNDKAPNLAIKSERAEHRIILYLQAQGKSPTEIANATGYGYQWILQIQRQPWYKVRLLEVIKECGGDAVKSFLDSEMIPSLEVLKHVRDNGAKDSDRVAAARDILNRGLGMPTVHVKTEQIKTPDGAKDEMATVERELANIRAAQQAIGLPQPN